MTAHRYDVLDVESTATTDEIRSAWRAAAFGQVLEAPRPTDPPERPESLPAAAEPSSRSRLPLVPGWLLGGVAALLALALAAVGVLLTKPADASVADDTQAAQAAAERAVVPILSYDAHHLARSEAAATAYLTDDERQQYQKLFAVVRQNAPRLGTVIRARYVSSGIVRSGTDRVDVLVFVDQVTTNKAHPTTPVVFKNQATLSMAKVGGTWLVDGITTTRS